MRITRKNVAYSVESIKFAKLHNSVRIYLFKNLVPLAGMAYIVATKRDEDTFAFCHFDDLKKAISYYLDELVRYA